MDANANTFENHLHVWYDSQGKYKYHGGMSDGDEDTATHKIFKVFYHIEDSNGVEHTLHVSTTEVKLQSNGVWEVIDYWYVGYDEVKQFFRTHCSNPDGWWND